ncbi:hypothetical protein J2W35_004188 [Variovorax boronicumulans]|uniref:HrpJ domain-containing protein n=1 Tax=Variovorax boronicumulans TaxID=436515 RepID=UPI00277E6952|nr:HrpJ domain-containing protein [Variovorax boronicumulans]MDQ0083822.1 hypothetical protein [Variovorax boronicumulans]
MISPSTEGIVSHLGALSVADAIAPDGVREFSALPGNATAAFSPEDWLADASEELTFQFSASVEARQKSLDARIEAVDDGLADVRIERIRQVLQLMEGPLSHTHVDESARRLARSYQANSAAARADTVAQPADPGKRYALMRLALEELVQNGHADATTRLRADLAALWTAQGARVRASLNIAAIANEYSPQETTAQLSFRAAYYQLMETAPTVRTLFDKLMELGGAEGPNKAHRLLQRAFWMDLQSVASSMDRTTLLLAGTTVSYLGEVCQSMVAFARDLSNRFGEIGVREDGMGRPAFETRCAKELLGISDSMTPPRGLLERLAVLLMGKNAEQRNIVVFYNALHRQMMVWPLVVWTVQDRKESVLAQLKRLLEKNEGVHPVATRQGG